jgi:hypothetical protein
VLRAVATWWDSVELWLTQLAFPVQVALIVAVVGPACWGVAAVLDRAVERSVAAQLTAAERRRQGQLGGPAHDATPERTP